MGTAASVDKPAVYSYQLVERLASQNHFRRDLEAYRVAMEDSIKRNALDILEVLLQAGNAKSIYPLHMSATLGILETMELIVSAGFSCSAKNEEALTPLHCSVMNPSVESALCTMFLGIRDPNTMNVRDANGSLPIHLAIERNNMNCVKALVELGAKLTAANGNGLTPIKLAKKLNRIDIEKYLVQAEKLLATAKSSGNQKRSGKQVGEPAIDMDRIMQVWEAFFQNAMSRFGVDEDDCLQATEAEIVDDESDYYGTHNASDYMVQAVGQRSNYPDRSRKVVVSDKTTSPAKAGGNSRKASSAQQNGKFGRLESFDSPKDPYNITRSSSQSSSYKSPSPEIGRSEQDRYLSIRDYNSGRDAIQAWFEWLLCFNTEINGYFVVHRYGWESSRWLPIHLEAMGRSRLLNTDEFSEAGELGWPYSVLEAINQGYMIYFDEHQNICQWMRLQCGTVENFLPVGADEEACYDIGLLPHQSGVDATGVLWMGCPQESNNQWVLVVSSRVEDTKDSASDPDYYDGRHRWRRERNIVEWDEPKRSQGDISCIVDQSYYFHRITGSATWTTPPGLEEYWEQLGGWQLCMSVDSNWHLYWWHADSNTSVWAEDT